MSTLDFAGDKRKMKLSGELSYRIGYDVEHDLFHAQNVFNDEYIKPTFIEYVQKLEKENAEIHQKIINFKKENVELEEWKEQTIKARGRDYMDWSRMKDDWNKMNDQLTKAKELLRQLVNIEYAVNIPKDKIISLRVKAEQFLGEVEK